MPQFSSQISHAAGASFSPSRRLRRPSRPDGRESSVNKRFRTAEDNTGTEPANAAASLALLTTMESQSKKMLSMLALQTEHLRRTQLSLRASAMNQSLHQLQWPIHRKQEEVRQLQVTLERRQEFMLQDSIYQDVERKTALEALIEETKSALEKAKLQATTMSTQLAPQILEKKKEIALILAELGKCRDPIPVPDFASMLEAESMEPPVVQMRGPVPSACVLMPPMMISMPIRSPQASALDHHDRPTISNNEETVERGREDDEENVDDFDEYDDDSSFYDEDDFGVDDDINQNEKENSRTED